MRYEFRLPTKAPRPRSARDEDWQQWIAENLLRNCTEDGMLATMTQTGLHPDECREAIHTIRQHPVFKAAQRHQQLQLKLESVLANLQDLWSSAPNYTTIERRSDLGDAEFLDRYVRGCRPVVLTDVASGWPALSKWTLEYFDQRFGDRKIEIQAGRSTNRHYELEKHHHRKMVTMHQFVEMVLKGGPANDCYLTANNEALRDHGLDPLLDDIGGLPSFCSKGALACSSSLWAGPAGTVTPLHHDSLMLLHTQISGRKHWRFISPLETPNLYNFFGVFSPVDPVSPDFNRWPRAAKARILETVLEPGETLFVPLGWWHHVTSLDVSISFSFSNFQFPNQFNYANPQNRDWF